MDTMLIQFSDRLLLDRLCDLAKDYAVSPDRLVSIAVQRLVDDVDFLRTLRIQAGKDCL